MSDGLGTLSEFAQALAQTLATLIGRAPYRAESSNDSFSLQFPPKFRVQYLLEKAVKNFQKWRLGVFSGSHGSALAAIP